MTSKQEKLSQKLMKETMDDSMRKGCCDECSRPKTGGEIINCSNVFCPCHSPLTKDTWRTRFDEQFGTSSINNANGLIKSFIESLLSTQRHAVIGEMKKWLDENMWEITRGKAWLTDGEKRLIEKHNESLSAIKALL